MIGWLKTALGLWIFFICPPLVNINSEKQKRDSFSENIVRNFVTF